jgi:voltage-gated sodium channel
MVIAQTRRARRVMSSPHIERAVAGVISANAVVLIAGLLVDGHERLFDTIHDAIVAFFLCELLARLLAHGWRFLRRPLNAFDATVILTSAMPMLGVDASLLRLARLMRLVHFVRHTSHLRALVACGARRPMEAGNAAPQLVGDGPASSGRWTAT